MKVESTVANARAVLGVRKELGSLDAYLWSFVGGRPIVGAWKPGAEIPSESPEARSMSRDLKRRGFRFVDHHDLRRRAGCQIAVEFRDPDNHSVEIYWGVDQVGSDGRVRPSSEWHGVQSLDQAIAQPVPGQDTHLPNPVCSRLEEKR